jgi:hypothetical protein
VAQWGPGLQLRPAMAAARAANTASSNIFAVSYVEDVWERRKEKEVSKWVDLIFFELCFYYLLSLLRGEKFLWGFFFN